MQNDNPMRVGDVRLHNGNIILESIYLSGKKGRSQSEIVVETKLKPPTILRFFTELENNGYITPIVEDKTSEQKTKGRPPVRYIVNSTKLYSVGIDFWAECASIAVFNFLQEKIYEERIEIPEGKDADFVLDKLVSMIEKAIKKTKINKSSITGIGVSAPGKVQVETGTIIWYPRISGMKNYPLQELLQKRTSCNIYVNNNCSVLALNEYTKAKEKYGNSLFVFLLRSGINGSFISNGNLYTSSAMTTLEIGHLPISIDGPLCSCGKNGCLEAWIRELNVKSSSSEVKEPLLFSSLEEKVLSKDKTALKTIEKAASYIYSSMNIVNNVLSPKAFLFIGMSKAVTDCLLNYIENLLNKESDKFEYIRPKCYSDVFEINSALLGASNLVMRSFFKI